MVVTLAQVVVSGSLSPLLDGLHLGSDVEEALGGVVLLNEALGLALVKLEGAVGVSLGGLGAFLRRLLSCKFGCVR